MFGMSKEEVKYMCESQGAIFVDVDEIFGAGMWDFDDLISLMKEKPYEITMNQLTPCRLVYFYQRRCMYYDICILTDISAEEE